MGFNYDFDIAALFIEAVVIFFYYYKKSIPSMQSRTFIMIVYTLAASTLLEIGTVLIKQYTCYFPIPLQWFLECLYYTSTNSFGLMYIMYCTALIDYFYGISKKKLILFKCHVIIPYVLALLVIWLSPFFHLVMPLSFSIYPGLGYVRNNNFWFYLLYVITVYDICYALFIVVRHRKNVSKKEIEVVFIYVLIVMLSVAIQLLFYGLFLQCFAMSLGLLLFFFYIQRPERVIDSITEIYNQTAFLKTTDQLFNRGGKFTCLALLLDDTVFMGNTIGITQMNRLLREVASFLKNRFSYSQSFCLNQECFCIVLKNSDAEKIFSAIDQIQKRFSSTWMYETVEVKLYSRICVINCPKDARASSDIVDIISMISNDERYKKSVLYASEIDLEDKRRTVYIEHALRNGLSENRFDVYYQPIYSTAKQKLIGAEALIRLRDENGQFISPEDFIPIAEKTGTILRIGEFVYEDVCRTLSVTDFEKYGIEKIDINLSVAQCMQENLAEQILTIQSIYNVPTSIINLEITETAAAHTPEIILKNMQNLVDAGFELSLDDYGSGYSNMNYLLNLPFKMIKIDKYIVWAAFTDSRAETALAATIKMIKAMVMTVLAEGVEKKEQAEWLIKLGCDYLQGFYYSKPVPKNEYLEIMKNRDNFKI